MFYLRGVASLYRKNRQTLGYFKKELDDSNKPFIFHPENRNGTHTKINPPTSNYYQNIISPTHLK